ncbi:hypothetical protein TW95_gp0597 [Pandoravirus inopinatum]|uniref:Uncharacterized protein n=1 Tax=Pandoravirus inopinatum TaxID=1605721 RepID=A0A0B5J936_9VIRU|nr:hypothetical protein TW95_gp0597 [Pandoravirus inopinatum]AJF97331.1 hypothetical protein [Pandoravirus inopinatum]
MGARMTAGLPAYDALGDDHETLANLADDILEARGGSAAQRPGADAVDTLRGLYRRPQVHFCCTTAAMRRIETLALRLPIDHVCAATGAASTDPDAMSWWVAMSPCSHQLLLASQVVVEVDRNRRHVPASTPSPSPWTNQTVCSSSSSVDTVVVQEDTSAMQAITTAIATPSATTHKGAEAQPKRRRRRRQRGRSKSALGGRLAVPPLSV